MNRDLAASATEAAGDRGAFVVGDVAEQSALEEAADRAQSLAPLMGWVNNAALAISGNLHDPKPDEIDRLFRVNLMGVFWGSSVAVRRFLAQGTAARSSTPPRSTAPPPSPAGPPTTPPRAASTH